MIDARWCVGWKKMDGAPENIEDLERELRAAAVGDTSHITPEYIDTKVSKANLHDIKAAIGGRMTLRNNHKLTQYSARVNIKTDQPVLLSFFGDQHLGSGDTDHDRWDRDFQYVMDTAGAYCVFGSNVIDNAIPGKFPDGMLQNVIPPEEQVVLMRNYTQQLNDAGKLLGVIVSPCHEGWTWQKCGQDLNRLLYDFEGRKFPVLENGSKLLVKVNDIEYYLAMYHQMGPFNSNLNKNNGTQRMRQLQHRNADIITAAHHHVAESMHTFVDKNTDMKPVVHLRTGCYKLDDQWAGGKGYIKGEPGGQSVELFADEKRMLPFLEIQTAIAVHKALDLESKYQKAKGLR